MDSQSTIATRPTPTHGVHFIPLCICIPRYTCMYKHMHVHTHARTHACKAKQTKEKVSSDYKNKLLETCQAVHMTPRKYMRCKFFQSASFRCLDKQLYFQLS